MKLIKGKRVKQKQGHGNITRDETMTAGLGLGKRVVHYIKDWKSHALREVLAGTRWCSQRAQ